LCWSQDARDAQGAEVALPEVAPHVLELLALAFFVVDMGLPAYFLTFTFSFLIVVVFLGFDNSGCLYFLSSTLGM
jgi:hypothetical protein